MKPKKLLHLLSRAAHTHFDEPDATWVANRSAELYREYCCAHSDDPPALKQHTEGMIYAGAALYRTLQEKGFPAQEALALTDEIFQEFASGAAEMLRKVLKIPGLYRKVPWLFRNAGPKKFSPAAGFRMKFYDVGSLRAKFDVTECPYFSTCKAMGCPELTVIFCNTDDCCYGNMHPKLRWNRTTTIGRGGEMCDFDIAVRE